MKKWQVLVAGVLALSLVLLGGCTSSTTTDTGSGSGAAGTTEASSGGGAAVDLSGTKWNCTQFNVAGSPQPVLASAPITAEFSADGKLTGNSGVNTYSTTYVTNGDGIEIGKQIVSTKMAGPQDAMDQESNYLLALPTAVRFTQRNNELVLLDAADGTVARYQVAE